MHSISLFRNGPCERLAFPLLLAFLLAAEGCSPAREPEPNGAEAPSSATTPAETDTTAQQPLPLPDHAAEPEGDAPASFEGTAGIVAKAATGNGPALLREVRTARHDAFDRIVFAFDGSALPGYHIAYIDSPVRKCGSGKVTHIEGDGWLEVRMYPANAHTEEGQPTVSDLERSVNYPVLKELELTCDFEADVTWVFGVGSPNHYRVIELSNPTRLVVDIKH
ncbi:MAG TPA: hypothetical protein VFG50_13205 [Rhodothermales bacterium]|nr:hypothetical protein [Rhodothermales bacterium]